MTKLPNNDFDTDNIPLDEFDMMLAYKSLEHFTSLFWKYADPCKFKTGKHLQIIAQHLEAVSMGKIKKLVINMPPRHKLLTTTPLATTNGWKTIGTIKIGDYVFAPDGKPVLVTDKSDVYNKQLFEVKTSDGCIIECDDDHLWNICLDCNKDASFKTMSTLELFNRQESTFEINSVPKLPYSSAVQYPERDLLVHPYVLGAWLGNGVSACGTMAVEPTDSIHIRAQFEKFGIETTDLKSDMIFGTKGLRVKLRKIGVLNNKHIPTEYLTASIEQRMWLLRGLIDTDGDVTKEGKVTFNGSNLRLVKQVCQLVHSFGLKASVTSIETGRYNGHLSNTSYSVMFKLEGAASLPRKAERCKTNNKNRARTISIRKTKRYGDVQCLTVANDDGLFLAGDGYVVTHNCKSSLVAVMWPAWEWLHFPTVQWLFTSYSHTRSTTDSVKCRNVVNSPLYLQLIKRYHPEFALTEDVNTKVKFSNSTGGYRLSVALNSATGEGGDRCICDDPNSTMKGESKIERDSINRFFSETFRTRINDPDTGSFVIIQQRVAEEDLTGYLLSTDTTGEWSHLCLPARYEGKNRIKTVLGTTDWRTKEGEPLWPEHWHEEALNSLEKDMGEYAIAGQMQQRPAPREGGMFKVDRIKVIDSFNRDDIDISVRGWDNAGTMNGGDWTVGVLIHRMKGATHKTYIIEDVVRGQWSLGEREDIKYETACKDGMSVIGWQEQEGGSGGKDVAKISTSNLAPFRYHTETSQGNKVIRADSFAIQIENDNVSMLKGEWNKAYISELTMFPSGKHDDQVDASSLAFNKIFVNLKRAGVWGSSAHNK